MSEDPPTLTPTPIPAPVMTRRAAILGLGFAATAGAALAITPRKHEALLGQHKLDEVVPQRVGTWNGLDGSGSGVVVPEDTQTLGYYDQVLTRTYVAQDAPPVMLLIAYGGAQSGMMKVHRPEICYASSGFKVIQPATRAIQLTAARRSVICRSFLAQRQSRAENVLYWTRVADAFPDSLDAQRWITIREGLNGIIPDGVLVRMSTLASSSFDAPALLATFAQKLVADATPLGCALLIGHINASATPRTASA